MAKIIIMLAVYCFLFPDYTYCQEQCGQDKILGTATITAKLKYFVIEDASNIPSNLIFTVNGKDLWIIADPEEIEKNFTGKEGKRFKIIYERVYGEIGDGCDEYERLKSFNLLK